MNNHLIPTSISSPPLIPNRDISNEVISLVNDVGNSKINLIKSLIDQLVESGRNEIQNINDSVELWHISCSFIRKAGDIIHLYERSEGSKFWSIIGPDEWSNNLIHLGSYRILYDYILEKI